MIRDHQRGPWSWRVGLLVAVLLGACSGRSTGGDSECGNGACEGGENETNCPSDCLVVPPVCGDGVCEPGEHATTCPEDCGDPAAECGDGICQAGESAASCPEDCAAEGSRCGDGVCDPEETAGSCPNDCVELPFLGDDCEPDDQREICNLESDADTTFEGEPGGLVGVTAAIVGDVDGDGLDDLVLGDPHDSRNGTGSGAAYLIYGKAGGWSGTSALDHADVIFVGAQSSAAFGWFVSAAGDVNGDGFADFLVGAPDNGAGISPGPGSAYLVLGRQQRYSGTLEVASTNQAVWIRFEAGASMSMVGTAVSGAGDVNGDGYADLLIGVGSGGAVAGDGAVELVYGGAELVGGAPSRSLDDADLHIANDQPQSWIGSTLAHADVNGDGYEDLLVGCPAEGVPDTAPGWVFLLNGDKERFAGQLAVSEADTRFDAEASPHGVFGMDIANVGDLDADGLSDVMLVGEDGQTRGYHLFYGRPEGFDAVVDIMTSDALIEGPSSSHAGPVVDTAGDVNDDGFDDFVAAAETTYQGQSGVMAAFLFLGGSLRLNGDLALDNANALFLVPPDPQADCPAWVGSVVAGGGDVTGDGFDDFLIGDMTHCGGGSYHGSIYLVQGVGP